MNDMLTNITSTDFAATWANWIILIGFLINCDLFFICSNTVSFTMKLIIHQNFCEVLKSFWEGAILLKFDHFLVIIVSPFKPCYGSCQSSIKVGHKIAETTLVFTVITIAKYTCFILNITKRNRFHQIIMWSKYPMGPMSIKQ